MKHKEESYDVVVCGGGLAGFCAAVASARNGVKTCLIQDRPVFGGNSSSEVRVTPHGAARFHGYARETGIISELLIEERARNHEKIIDNGWQNSIWDMTLYDMAMNTSHLTCHLNTTVLEVIKQGERKLESIVVRTLNAEVEIQINGKIFIDCTGDGFLADQAGCEWRMGTESRTEFGEPHAPAEASKEVMGSSILFKALDMGYSVPYKSPDWAFNYEDASFFLEKGREITSFNNGYWWIEIGVPWHTIYGSENIRHELTRHVFGVWDWIKNKSPELKIKSANFALDWIGQIPGKRESRRVMGKYLMSEHDVLKKTVFSDEVAYGGWYIDIHAPGGLLAEKSGEMTYEEYESVFGVHPRLYVGPYGIPLRIMISKDIDNLMMAGRNVSVTHAALGTVRVMATTSIMGEAVGTAASIAIQDNMQIVDVPEQEHIMKKVQQSLLRNGCFLPHHKNEDPLDLARAATVSASSEAKVYGVGPQSRSFTPGLNKLFKEKNIDPSAPQPGASDELLQARGQWIAIGTDRIKTIAVCLSNLTKVVQSIDAQIVPVEHIWDYRCEGLQPIACKSLQVPPGSLQWIHWEVNVTREQGLVPGKYIRLDLSANPDVIWHAAGTIEPGQLSAFDYGQGQMRRYQYGRTMSFLIDPPQPSYRAENVLSGITRPYQFTNVWRSDPNLPLPQYLQLHWEDRQTINQIELTFPGNLFREYGTHEYPFYRDPECPKDYGIFAWNGNAWEQVAAISGNYQRRRIHEFRKPIATNKLRIVVYSTNGDPSAAIYEVRCY